MRLPWRLTFQYASQDKPSNRAHYDREDAERSADEILTHAQRRESSVTLKITNRDTGESYAYPREAQGEDQDMMAGRNDVNTPEGEAVIEQIKANIERARPLALEDPLSEALDELDTETETLISSLAGKGCVAVKQTMRDAWREATEVEEAPSAQVAKAPLEGVVVEKTWEQFPGMEELVTMGAQKVAEGIRQHAKLKELAGDIARVTFDMWLRLPNKEELPDLKGASDRAKKASGKMYALANEGFEHTEDNEKALKSLERGVQRQRTDVRAQWIRSLDEDTEEAAERRALFGDALKDKPKDVPYSRYVAVTLYDSPAMLKGEGEKSLERWHRKQEALKAGQDPKELEPAPEEVDEATANEWLLQDAQKLASDVAKARTTYYRAASPEAREQAQKVFKEVFETVRQMVAETI